MKTQTLRTIMNNCLDLPSVLPAYRDTLLARTDRVINSSSALALKVLGNAQKVVTDLVRDSLDVAGEAWARSVITTLAGCHSEFGNGSASKACAACVKSKGRYTQHAAKKGVWVCE